ncbi:hypothetical protein [Enterococcus lemanii]|uniref:Uncharacterized protein n=1 Tax=Enterococcus lemanii TaxID=1159752 RepID=A0ABV9MU73_9ENTE|nr:hypothetical protein [Enterococcus lemanii]MBM7709100.1 hypothetical protein [Enterococcus lemanii]NLM66387.1 hypothetical protein [Enterococcus sp.]
MNKQRKKYLAITTVALIGLVLGLFIWKMLLTFGIINLNQLAPKSYTRAGSSYGFIFVFLIPILATCTLFAGISWKK